MIKSVPKFDRVCLSRIGKLCKVVVLEGAGFFFLGFCTNIVVSHSATGLTAMLTPWASPREKSKGKGQRQKVKLLYFNIKENKATGHKSTCLASRFFAFLDFFLPYWVWAKKYLFFKNQI